MNEDEWRILLNEVEACRRCSLCRQRLRAVPGEGSKNARLMVVGEGPGAQEDAQGRPFVGPAGQLLDKMLISIGLAREEVYITNTIKCRPPANRTPSDGEIEACLPYLRRQIALVSPRVILCLGTPAARTLIDPALRIGRDRGRWVQKDGRHYLPTYHPAYLLRDATKMIDTWRDLQALKTFLAESKL